jgi:P-type Ca2+ transporter type 2C
MTNVIETSSPATVPSPYRLPATEVIAKLNSDAANGLSESEAARRLKEYGPNQLQSKPPVPGWKKFVAQFKDPLVLLLIVATLISLAAWALEGFPGFPFEAFVIVAIVILNAVIGYIQEARAEEAVAALQKMTSAHATVMRGGKQLSIASAELVPGDILLIEEGNAITADGRLLEVNSLQMAEAALTGESQPVTKDVETINEEAPLGDWTNMIFSGTACTFGRGRAIITSTGMQTELGKIAGLIQDVPEEATPLQQEIDRVSKFLGIAVIIIAVIVVSTLLFFSDITNFQGVVDALLLGVSLAVAAVPEGLPAVLTVVLSLGVQRMAKRRAIVKKLSAVETLGSASVIGTDKTGTLTRNEMTVVRIVTASGQVDLSGTGYDPQGEILLHRSHQPIKDAAILKELDFLLRAGVLANNAVLEKKLDKTYTIQGDPTEAALLVAAQKAGLNTADTQQRFQRVGEVPFSSERKMMSTVQAHPERSDVFAIASKGAPDVLLGRSYFEFVNGQPQPLSESRRREILASVDRLARDALRTLGLAGRYIEHGEYQTADEDLENALVWLGMVGIIDPPRPEARAAIADARNAGIQVLMITGDHPLTATAIGNQLGLISPNEQALTGSQMQKLSDTQLEQAVRDVKIYARVSPEDKLRIVKALRKNGNVTAMTGDGVNDAPALKTADIGVTMGITGTDVAKEAAEMILVDDNFATIVAAVEEGRSIFDNIRKFLRYLLSSNIGEVFTMFFGVVFGSALGLVARSGEAFVVPLLATQILWINLLTDTGPALAVGVDPVDPDVMKRPPRRRTDRVIDAEMWFNIGFVGLLMALVTLGVMDLYLPNGLIAPNATGDIILAQTMSFTTLVFCQLFNVFNARSEYTSAFSDLFTNRWLWFAVLLGILLQAAVIYLPILNQAFGTTPLDLKDWGVAIGLASSVLWGEEVKKIITRAASGLLK